jgi:hypothetical protein
MGHMRYKGDTWGVIIGLGLSLFLSACAGGPRQLGVDDLALIRQEPTIIAMVYQPPPPFRHNTTWGEGMGVVFGPIGLATAEMKAQKSGARVRAKIGLEDPVFLVRDKFLTGIAAELGIEQPSLLEELYINDLEQRIPTLESGLLLEFRTMGWGIGAVSNPFRANLYGVGYQGGVRLIRLEDRQILWKGFCIVGTRDDQKATIAALQEHEGSLLREWLAEAAEKCAEIFLFQFSGKSNKQW